MDTLIPVYLTPEDAALFALFMKNYDSMAFMLQHRVFDMKQGNVTLNFDKSGVLSSIDSHSFHYRK